MSGFSAEWLSLREPADHAARSVGLTRAALDVSPGGTPPRILDLAAGTGSNLRYLLGAGRLAGRSADFLLVDHAQALLDRVPKSPFVATRCLDLSTLDGTIFDGRSLVTASALLDLVSDEWLGALASHCAASGATVLFALSFDGRIVCSPEDEWDGAIVGRVNRHQRTDKGFGPALGAAASNCAARSFRDRGYHVTRDRSDWVLTAASAELQRQLIDGWARAAAEIAPLETREIAAWRVRRHAHIDAGSSHIIVGHEDMAAWVR